MQHYRNVHLFDVIPSPFPLPRFRYELKHTVFWGWLWCNLPVRAILLVRWDWEIVFKVIHVLYHTNKVHLFDVIPSPFPLPRFRYELKHTVFWGWLWCNLPVRAILLVRWDWEIVFNVGLYSSNRLVPDFVRWNRSCSLWGECPVLFSSVARNTHAFSALMVRKTSPAGYTCSWRVGSHCRLWSPAVHQNRDVGHPRPP
jgi:hypothetical protein